MFTAYESLLTLPVPYRAHYRHHQMLWSILAAQGIEPRADPGQLNVLFLASPLGKDCTRLLLRASQPLGLPGEQSTSFQFSEGEQVELLVKISLSFAVRNETGARRTVYAGEQDRHRYIANKYARYGLDCTGCDVVSDERLSIQKRGQSFFLPCVTAKVSGRVTHSDDFGRSFIEGVGGKKAFGAGLPLLISGGSG